MSAHTTAIASAARRASSEAPRRAERFGAERLPGNAGGPATPRLPGWIVERPLARGGQADVFLVRRERRVRDGDATDAADRAFAAKVFRLAGDDGEPYRAEEQRWRLRREVVALRRLERAGCPGVPRVVALGSTSLERGVAGRPWYVMPYYAAGAMWRPGAPGLPERWVEPLRGRVDRVLDVAASLAATLAALHDGPRRIVHRDVTAANVFFAERGGAPVLGDFGLALLDDGPERPVAADAPQACWSNPWTWRPPELDAGDGYTTGPEGDLFMLGGLVYQALSGGRFLPPAREWDGACIHERPAFTLRRHSADARIVAVEALLERLLTRDPAHRLPAREVARVCRAVRELPG